MKLHIGDRFTRNHCEGCGCVPTDSADYWRPRINAVGRYISLCQRCRKDVLAVRHWNMPVQAVLEELWERRYLAPRPVGSEEPQAAYQGTSHSARPRR